MVIEFTVPGKPVGKGRPRVGTIAGHAHMYTPKVTVQYENWIKQCYLKAAGHTKLLPPLTIKVLATYTVPKSYGKQKRIDCLRGYLRPRKPDWDNIGKVVCDALNKLAYDDDVDIYDAHVIKRYDEHDMLRIQLTGTAPAAEAAYRGGE